MSIFQSAHSVPVLKDICLHLSKQRLPAVSEEKTAEEILDEAYEFRGFGVHKSIEPSPSYPTERVTENKAEYAKLAKEVEKRNPETILEIGTARGGSLYLWSRFFHSVEKIISIDLGSHIDSFEDRSRLFRHFTDAEMEILIADSHSQRTREEVERNIDTAIDFLFIDGDHSYEGIKSDFEMYSDLVASDGVIAFHDIVNEEWPGVGQFYEEIEPKYDTTEIVEPPKRIGIGIIEQT